MSALSILDQLLKAGTQAANRYNAQQSDAGRYATGAAAGSLLTLLLGSRSGRRLGGSALKLGSVAALGMLAWKTYAEWQARQPAGSVPAPSGPERFELLPAAQVEAHGQAMLRAMIAAAKSDGHLDEREQGLVNAELQRLNASAGLRSWVEQELRSPIDPAAVAAAASTPELASEIYLTSVLVVDDASTMERAYLDALARELRLADSLKADLESRAAAA